MGAQKCSNCSAPLSLVGGTDVVTCTYCGTDNRVGGLSGLLRSLSGLGRPQQGGAPADRVASQPGRRTGAEAAPVLGAVVALVLVGLAVASVFMQGELQKLDDPSDPGVVELPLPPPGPVLLPLDQLASLDRGGWKQVQVLPFDGTFLDFDVVARVPWVMEMARHWAPDVRLDRIYVDGLDPTGKLDLSVVGEGDVDYRLFSPARRAQALVALETSEEEVITELRFRLQREEVKVLVQPRSGIPARAKDSPANPDLSCSLATLVPQALEQGLDKRPHYDAFLSYLDRDRGQRAPWRWNISGKSTGSASFFAADCSPW